MTDSGTARPLLIEALGIQSEFWGLGRMTGQLYAVLYCAPVPLSLAQLADALGVTKGAVSVGIRRLEELRMVRRQHQPADRRVFFVAMVDFWEIARQFLSRRYEPAFARTFELVSEALARAEQDADGSLTDGLRALQRFYSLLDRLAAMLVETSPADIERLLGAVGPLPPSSPDGGKP